MKKLKHNSLFLTALLFSVFARAQTVYEFSVKQTVEYGLKNAVQVRNALIDIKIQEQTNREFTSAAYPQLSASVSTNYYFNVAVQSISNFIAPATYNVLIDEGVKNGSGNPIVMPNGGKFGNIPVQFGTPWVTNIGLDFSQILFDGQVFVGLQARNAALDLATKTAEVTSEQVKANIYKIYYQLVVGKSQVASLQANIDRFEKLLADTREIYKNGFAEKLDVDKIIVQLNNLNTEKEKVMKQLSAGNAGLKFLINMPQKNELLLTDTLAEEGLKSNILDESYSYEDRKEIQLLTVASKLREYNVKRYKLSRLPTLLAIGSYNKNAQRYKYDFFNDGDWYTSSFLGVKLVVPIFEGFAKKSRIENAKLVLQKANNNLEQAKESMDYDVIQARIRFRSAVLTADVQKQNIRLAEDVFNTTRKKYEQGLGSNQEIYNAQTELRVAQSNYYSALYDAITSKVDYLRVVGKL